MRVFRFLTALIKYVLFGRILDNKSVQHRISICNECSFYNSNKDKCEKCGCFIRAKSIMSTELCPINKW